MGPIASSVALVAGRSGSVISAWWGGWASADR